VAEGYAKAEQVKAEAVKSYTECRKRTALIVAKLANAIMDRTDTVMRVKR
jgi:hypothetical protein